MTLLLAHLCLVTGLLIGLLSWRETVRHIGASDYVLPPDFPGGTSHA